MQQVYICTNVSKYNSLYISRDESNGNSYWVLFVYLDLECVCKLAQAYDHYSKMNMCLRDPTSESMLATSREQQQC